MFPGIAAAFVLAASLFLAAPLFSASPNPIHLQHRPQIQPQAYRANRALASTMPHNRTTPIRTSASRRMSTKWSNSPTVPVS
jgi:hypothetical protein